MKRKILFWLQLVTFLAGCSVSSEISFDSDLWKDSGSEVRYSMLGDLLKQEKALLIGKE